jgi:hypothetical protein
MNPAIEFKEEYDKLENKLLSEKKANQLEYERYNKLSREIERVCTHKDEKDQSTWKEISDGFSICSYCGLTQ